MALKLMYITNRPDVASIAEAAGVDRIFVDLEYIGKSERQRGMDTVQSHHTIADIQKVRTAVHKAELLVRCNPIHEGSAQEIDAIIAAGADMVMLPYFKTVDEVKRYIDLVNGRAKIFPLLETPEASDVLEEILDLPGIDEIHIGINDLSLGYKKKFLFEVLADGTVDRLCAQIRARGIPYGFGGIASLGKGLLPAEYIIREHYRIGSTRAILSRSFCNADEIDDIGKVKEIFDTGLEKIRAYEAQCEQHPETYEDNRLKTRALIWKIVEGMH